MADQKITALSSATPAQADLVPFVSDPAGTPVTKQTTIATLIDKAVKVASTSGNQAPAANTDTYITGSDINVDGRLKVGSVLKWQFLVTKTAAGTAAPVWNIRFGTAASTADTSRVALTGSAQTGAVDTGWFEIVLVVQAVGASGQVHGFMRLNHILATTGLGISTGVVQVQSGTFDTTVASLKAGVSINTGASGAWTFRVVMTEAYNLV